MVLADQTSVKRVVKKHTSAVHSAGKLSLLQRKISNSLLYHAYDNLNTVEEHEITIGELCNLIAYSGRNYQVIKDSLKGLISTVVEWNVLDECSEEEDWSASSIIASARIKGGNCYYAYSPRMRELLASPAMYAKINLYVQSRFHSAYGLALYENCIRYRNLQSTKWFDLQQFRKLMGVADEKYKLFKDFKKRVIDKAIDEVNTYSDISIQVVYGKVGRRVQKLRFLINERPKKARLGAASPPLTQPQDLSSLSKHIQKEFSLSQLHANKLVSEYGESYLDEKIKYVKSTKIYKTKKGAGLAAYFVSAVKNDYKATEKEQAVSQKGIKEFYEPSKAYEENVKRDELHKLQVETIISEFNALPTLQKEKILSDFRSSLNHNALLKLYEASGLDNPLIKDRFIVFFKRSVSVSW